jgi:hypothetical protein
MGGCASSKYVVDEDDLKGKKPKEKKDKKSKNQKNSATNNINSNANGHVNDANTDGTKNTENKATLEEGLDFIDKEEIDKQNQQQQQSQEENDNGKKEVTTYQTTVVKHVSKEGDELLVHLKDEAFQSLKNFLKQESKSNETTIKSTIDGEKVSTSSFNNDSKNEVEFLNEIKTQVINAIKNTLKNEPIEVEVDEKLVNSIIELSAGLVKNGQVNSMSELEESLNKQFPQHGLLIQKIINSTTGFLTAKGTEAGTMLSSILANLTNSSIQGELKETEKTTVKVTRTITEKIVNSKGETKIITRKITDTIQNPTNLAPEELVKQLAEEHRSRSKAANVILESSVKTEEKEVVEEIKNTETSSSLPHQAEEITDNEIEAAKEVVTNVVKAAILKVSEENQEVTEQATINSKSNEEEVNNEDKSSKSRDDIASEFYKSGKDAAEKLIKIVDSNVNSTTTNNNNDNDNNKNDTNVLN